MKTVGKFTNIGGQAVIEGVMMRSPHFIAIAVRKSDQKMVIKWIPYTAWSQKFPLFKKPVFRGISALIESMIQGMNALSFSADVAAGEENQRGGKKLSTSAIVVSMLSAFVMGMGLFVALPHLLTLWLTSSSVEISLRSPLFHLIDGILKIIILLTYVYLIALMRDIRRVFEYHGAEHKSIYTFEAGEELTVENASQHTTLHPRCGTSFLLFVVLISIAVFSIIFPVLGLTDIFKAKWLNHLFMIICKIVLTIPVAGIAYEFIKMCACRMDSPFFKMLIWPGMILQKLTTREPSSDQLEVALASLKQVLQLEKTNPEEIHSQEIEINHLADIAWVHAHVAEFPEA